jgi:quercetin dioxygenase-like cupin family protein
MLCCDLLDLDVQPHRPRILDSALGAGQVVAVDLSAGDELRDHRTHERTFVLVLRGVIDVNVEEGDSGRGTPGTLFAFDRGEARAIKAAEPARIVLILGS